MSCTTPLRCYYDVLQVGRNAPQEEIRKAYKHLALILHPDKNHGNTEATEEQFKELHNAYTILSDPSERSWYDSHREGILSGDPENTSAPEEINLFGYFSSQCFDSCFDESKKVNFYSTYQNVFDTLKMEESKYDSRAGEWPAFGTSISTPQEVASFYKHWKSFFTYKTFAWKDIYKKTDMPDRYSRRAAERINQKERATAKKDYLQLVIDLVQFIHRRDPRIAREQEKQEAIQRERIAKKMQDEEEICKIRAIKNQKFWEEVAEEEAREEVERSARGDVIDGSLFDILYEKQRNVKAMKKCGPSGGDAENSVSNFAMLYDDEVYEKEKDNFDCSICKKRFLTKVKWNEHILSAKHKLKEKKQMQTGLSKQEGKYTLLDEGKLSRKATDSQSDNDNFSKSAQHPRKSSKNSKDHNNTEMLGASNPEINKNMNIKLGDTDLDKSNSSLHCTNSFTKSQKSDKYSLPLSSQLLSNGRFSQKNSKGSNNTLTEELEDIKYTEGSNASEASEEETENFQVGRNRFGAFAKIIK